MHILFDLLPNKFDAYQEKFFQIGGILLIGLVVMDILPIGLVTRTVYEGICGALGI